MAASGVDNLSKQIRYRFTDPSTLQLALTHKSFANENPIQAPQHNERLEFLGDAVLDFVISDLLMTLQGELSEGDLSKVRAHLVNEGGLADIARELDLGQHIRLGKGEIASNGQKKASILSDSLEALIAAIYLDSKQTHGISEIYRVIEALFSDRIAAALDGSANTDYKTTLQESVQKAYKDNVLYQLISEAGPDHEKEFEVAVLFQDREFGRGVGRSKKQAEQAAAQAALLEIKKELEASP